MKIPVPLVFTSNLMPTHFLPFVLMGLIVTIGSFAVLKGSFPGITQCLETWYSCTAAGVHSGYNSHGSPIFYSKTAQHQTFDLRGSRRKRFSFDNSTWFFAHELQLIVRLEVFDTMSSFTTRPFWHRIKTPRSWLRPRQFYCRCCEARCHWLGFFSRNCLYYPRPMQLSSVGMVGHCLTVLRNRDCRKITSGYVWSHTVCPSVHTFSLSKIIFIL